MMLQEAVVRAAPYKFWKEVAMQWSQSEIEKLSPILERVHVDLEPLNGKSILVLCSAAGEIPFLLAERMTRGHILGIELNDDLLEAARLSAREKHVGSLVEFRKAEKTHLPLPDNTYDALISEFIVFPTPMPTEIGQPEMARVLKPGGRMVITDVIIPQPLSPEVRKELNTIGLDYLCEGTADDFRHWMQEAGLTDIVVEDLTPTVKAVWEQRRDQDHVPEHRIGYSLLLDDSSVRLGEGILYIYVRGTKPVA
jgi:ubiquinone/menaquinone biosynthesis C-methylase UbiE